MLIFIKPSFASNVSLETHNQTSIFGTEPGSEICKQLMGIKVCIKSTEGREDSYIILNTHSDVRCCLKGVIVVSFEVIHREPRNNISSDLLHLS